jgi:hypothetical protein
VATISHLAFDNAHEKPPPPQGSSAALTPRPSYPLTQHTPFWAIPNPPSPPSARSPDLTESSPRRPGGAAPDLTELSPRRAGGAAYEAISTAITTTGTPVAVSINAAAASAAYPRHGPVFSSWDQTHLDFAPTSAQPPLHTTSRLFF